MSQFLTTAAKPPLWQLFEMRTCDTSTFSTSRFVTF